MTQTSISIMVDEDVKRDAEALFPEIGTKLSRAVNDFLRHAVNMKTMPYFVTITEEEERKIHARQEFGRAIRAIQEESVKNGTDTMTLAEINEIIAEVRREARDEGL
ncbi:MAG: hypothetical protein FWB74_07325 [Defluviitaleaceae bacterium]|nr:hypothetical protein [Defluviitaleaceae bacterium]